MAQYLSRYIVCEACCKNKAEFTVYDWQKNPIHYYCESCTRDRYPEKEIQCATSE